MLTDVTVVGAGLIALASALELGDRGVRVSLIGTTHRGEASSAAAGMLAPSSEGGLGSAHHFALASRDLYPDYLARLEARSEIPVPLNRLGVLQIALTPDEIHTLPKAGGGSEAVGAAQIREIEPSLAPVAAGVLHTQDGALDPLLLLDALRILVARHEHITVYSENVCELRSEPDSCQVVTDRENRYLSSTVVLAAGAWTPTIAGLPRPLPIEPVRGQIVAYGPAYSSSPLRHVIFSAHGYLVPKSDGHLLAGSTMEQVGFIPETTAEGIAAVRGGAARICPELHGAPASATWAGLRPVTPDLLPILGRDPDAPNVVYACGHSRNGVLMAPATAEVVGDIVTGKTSQYDLTQFRPDRF